MKRLFDWIINNYTYVQIFIFICLLFLLSLVPIGYFWIQTHLRQIRILEAQKIGLKEEALLEKFLGEIQAHRILSQNSFKKGTIESKELQILNQQILDTLQKAEDFNQQKSTNKYTQDPFWQTVDPTRLKIKWNELNEQLPHVSQHQNEILHTAFLHDIVIQFPYLGDRVGVGYFTQFDKYVLVQNIFVRLPSIQEYLAQLILLSLEILQNPTADRPIQRINSLVVLLNSDLENLEHGISLHKGHNNTDSEHQQILQIVSTYRNDILALLQTVKTRISTIPKPTIPLSEFQQESDKALNNGFRLWEEGLKVLEIIFDTEVNYIFFRLWFVLFITILFTSFAIYLGLALILTAIKRLSNLTLATESFTKGNLTVRVVDPYVDQIGRQAAVFNRMAQKLETTIRHLYELLDATTALANGKLTARIQNIPQDKEFEQVALSFNTMAETFEKIIGRLQKTSGLLTTSASKIATASKEQETIVIKQEETTREISQTSGEISSTARAFAETMNQVSFSAERTSDLAVSGKDSLTHMEKIMHTMVEASQGIASKLAILSEKASNITTVVTTITKVADQTNLLSLNASIEAEKAGEFGRGFAVIAREIRRLADQTAISTLDIEKMIHEITTAITESVSGVGDFTHGIENGTEGMRAVGEQLTAIIEQVQAFTSQIEGVNQGMQAQSEGAEQINLAISRLSQTAAQTTQAIHQFQITMQELNQLANELNILNPFSSSKRD